jgi:exportin-2 (importin alpha re-exporter)
VALQNPILRADALKYLTTFRSLISKADAIAVFPHVVRALNSDSNVVHSYAAIAVERLLSMKVRPIAHAQAVPWPL